MGGGGRAGARERGGWKWKGLGEEKGVGGGRRDGGIEGSGVREGGGGWDGRMTRLFMWVIDRVARCGVDSTRMIGSFQHYNTPTGHRN